VTPPTELAVTTPSDSITKSIVLDDSTTDAATSLSSTASASARTITIEPPTTPSVDSEVIAGGPEAALAGDDTGTKLPTIPVSKKSVVCV
jgi:hypothetical protein